MATGAISIGSSRVAEAERVVVLGAGGLSHWLSADDIRGKPAEAVLRYEPMPAWITDMGGIAFVR